MNRLCIVTLLMFSCVLFLQGQLNLLNDEKLMNEILIPSDSAYQIFIHRYKKSLIEKDVEHQFKYAKLLSILTLRKGNLEETPLWHRKVDSLALFIPKVIYDKEYEYSKITYFQGKQMSDSVALVLEKMKPLALASKDTFWILNYYSQMARYFMSRGDGASAYKYIFLTDSLNSIYKSEDFKAGVYGLKGKMMWKEDKWEEVINFYQKAINIYVKLGKQNHLLPYYRDMITAALLLGRKEDARKWDNELKRLQKKYTSSLGFFDGEINRIFFYIKLEDYAKALEQADTAIALGNKMGRNITHAIYLKGIAYRGLDQYDKAAPLIETAFDMSKARGNNERCQFYAEALYQTFYWKKKYQPALEWYTTFVAFRDSVFNEKKLQEMTVYESKLETLEQKRKLEELEAKALIQKQRNSILWLIFGLFSIGGFSLLYVKNLKTKEKLMTQQIQLTESNLAREKLEHQLEIKEKEITTQVLSMVDKNTILQEIKVDLGSLKAVEDLSMIRKIIHIIDKSISNDNEWDKFLKSFKSLHTSFYEKLNTLNDQLTASEIRLASLLKMNLSSKEISSLLNITNEGVKKSRYRLRKKLGLESEVNIQDYLLNLS